MDLSEKQIDSNRREILRLLISSPREGMENVIDYLYSSGFFTTPSSRDGHHSWRGGLAQHSLDVCKIALDISRNTPKQSIIICGLLHDICKASKLYYDENGKIRQRSTHKKGHGIRSIKLLQMLGLKLNEEERLAIRWHMGGHHAQEEEKSDLESAQKTELWGIIHKADYLDAYGKYPEA